MFRRTVFFSLSVVSLLIFTGCGLTDKLKEEAAKKVTEKVVESATNGEVSLDNNTVTFSDSNTSLQFGDNVTLPDNFPTDIPMYDNSKVVGSSVSNDTFFVTLTSADPSSTVSEYYKTALPAQNWKIDNTQNFTTSDGQTTIYTGSKERRSVNVGIYETSDKSTSISIATAEKK